MALSQVAGLVIAHRVNLVLIVKQEHVARAKCNLFNTTVDVRKQREFMYFIDTSLKAKLSLTVVSSYKDFTFSCHDSCATLTTTNMLHTHSINAIGGVNPAECWSCWLEARLSVAKACGTVCSRAPSVEVAAVSN